VIGNSSMVKWRKQFLPANAPPLRGKDVDLRMFVNSDHAGDKLTWWSCTGFLIYLNIAPIVWHSKKQSTIETSSMFGAEFVAMKQGMEEALLCRPTIQTMNDGSSNQWTILDLW
jgi:hypothetical protein